MSKESLIRRLNRGSNQLFYQLSGKPHYMTVYAKYLGDAVRGAHDIIHLGAGPLWLGEVCKESLEGKNVYAVDPDAEALARNPAQHKVVAYGESIPLPDASIDVITSEHIAEHLEQPQAVLQEAYRLLRPGGKFIFTAPNLLSYSGIATHNTPQSFHVAYLKFLQRTTGSAKMQPYPTFFRINTQWAVHRQAKAAGFEVTDLWFGTDHPTYTSAFPGIHQAAVLFHLVLDKVEALAPFRLTLTAVLTKPK
jgi:SAM-dependent methyltransferase